MKRNSIRSYVTVTLLLAALTTALSQSLMGLAIPKANEMTDVVSYPLPSLPEPLLLGGDLRVDVKAGSDTIGWEARIASRFGSANLEYLNSSYVAGEDVFVNCGIFVFNSGDTLNRLHPRTLEVMEEWSGGEFTNVTACAFSVVKNVPSINVGQRTPALFYVRDMVVYCKRVADMDHTVSAQILENQFYPDKARIKKYLCYSV